jgi:hypothetical protein
MPDSLPSHGKIHHRDRPQTSIRFRRNSCRHCPDQHKRRVVAHEAFDAALSRDYGPANYALLGTGPKARLLELRPVGQGDYCEKCFDEVLAIRGMLANMTTRPPESRKP